MPTSGGTIVDSVDNVGSVTRTITDPAGDTVETIENYTGNGGPDPAHPDENVTTAYNYDAFGRLVTQSAVNPVTYSIAGESVAVPVDFTSSQVYSVYSVEDLGVRFWTWPTTATTSSSFSTLPWDAGSTTTAASSAAFTPKPTDVLVATVVLSSGSAVMTGMTWQNGDSGEFEGIVKGYDGAASTISFSGTMRSIPAGTLAAVVDQQTEYLYNCTIDADWQTGVVAPDSTDSLTPDANGDWQIQQSGTDHTSTTYDQLGRIRPPPTSAASSTITSTAPRDRRRRPARLR